MQLQLIQGSIHVNSINIWNQIKCMPYSIWERNTETHRKLIRQLYDEHCKEHFEKKLGITQFTIAYSRPPNIRSELTRSKLHQAPLACQVRGGFYVTGSGSPEKSNANCCCRAAYTWTLHQLALLHWKVNRWECIEAFKVSVNIESLTWKSWE